MPELKDGIDRTKGVLAYDPYLAKYVPASDAQVAEHVAQAQGDPAPGDRRPEGSDADRLTGGGPVVTVADAPVGNEPGTPSHEGQGADEGEKPARTNRAK